MLSYSSYALHFYSVWQLTTKFLFEISCFFRVMSQTKFKVKTWSNDHYSKINKTELQLLCTKLLNDIYFPTRLPLKVLELFPVQEMDGCTDIRMGKAATISSPLWEHKSVSWFIDNQVEIPVQRELQWHSPELFHQSSACNKPCNGTSFHQRSP